MGDRPVRGHPRVAARAAVAVLLLALGAVAGLSTVALHRLWWGLPLAFVATAAVLLALPGGWWLRLPFALGWVAALALLAGSRPEGDFLVAGDARGWILLASGVVVLLGGIVGVRDHPDPDVSTTAGITDPTTSPS